MPQGAMVTRTLGINSRALLGNLTVAASAVLEDRITK